MTEKELDKSVSPQAGEPAQEAGPAGVQERVPAAQAEEAFRRDAAGEDGGDYRPLDRLCVDCRWAAKPAIVGQWNYANCTYTLNPINLVTGRRIFPCVISRGFDQLCGWKGVHWEKR